MSRLHVLTLTAAALAASAATATAMPSIAPVAGGDDLWGAQETPEYVITASQPDRSVNWEVERSGGEDPEGEGPSPLVARIEGLPEGRYKITAREQRDSRPTRRRFTIDLTPPAEPLVVSPAADATYDRGQVVLAAYTCAEGACEGSVPVGEPIDTSTPGTFTFSVAATDPAGNVTVATRAYTVAPGPPTAAAAGGAASPDAPPAPGGTPPPAPTPLAQPTPTGTPAARLRPVLLHARLLKPRAGASFAALRPTLRWKPRRGTVLYNVQVFRLDGMRLRKVLSAFPRVTRYRVPKNRLKRGQRYVWRVWPYLGRAKGFTPRPLAVSFFDVRPRRR